MNLIVTVTYLILIGLIALLAILLLRRNGSKEDMHINSAILSPAEVEKHAVAVARSHVTKKGAKHSDWLASRVSKDYRYIYDTYKRMNHDISQGFPVPPAVEWLLDNFYIIEEQAKDIYRNLLRQNCCRLPVLKSGYLKGYPRIYAIASELVTHTDGNIDEKTLVNFVKSYQTQSLLSVAELWALPVMLRAALIRNIRYICEAVNESQNQRHKADELVNVINSDKDKDYDEMLAAYKQKFKDLDTIDSTFAVHLLRKLRDRDNGASLLLQYLEGKLIEQNSSTEAIASSEHQVQAARKVSIGNSIVSLKSISTMDWMEIFESLSQVERILRQDPSGVYGLMDFESRDYYRRVVEKMAKRCRVSETLIALKAVECASEALESANSKPEGAKTENPECHVGYYLIGKGRKKLEQKIGRRDRNLDTYVVDTRKRASCFFLGAIALITLLITVPFVYYAADKENYIGLAVILAAVVTLIPASDIAIAIINFIVTHMFEPAVLPKLELKDGVPEEFSTMVIVPTLLPNEKRVAELLRQMETNYLANKEKNIYFALVGDFKDAESEELPEDSKIVNAALSGVRELNEKYAKEGKTLFFFFHRHRQLNSVQGRWMGWERKRGAIIELNDLLRGSEKTSYSIMSCDVKEIPHVKYVITLDADTLMPIGSAKKLIGAIAHPMNRAIVDKETGVVVEGYGLLQPRIDINITSANSTMYSKIFAGQGGIDPYTTAVSDVYQDLFREGIFTGKGIYELDVFQGILKDAIPENAVLSHDLLEGSYIRAGLVSDISLVDGYPARYNSSSMRLHRWVRGDWQLLPWLGSKVKDRHGNRRKNPLSLISKWKILDNMRRSLINPSLFLLIILGVSIFPGNSLVWVGLALITAVFPTIMYLIGRLFAGGYQGSTGSGDSTVIRGFRASLYQSVLQIVFIAYQAYLMCDAISRTIIRVLFTRKNMLEWVTAADMEASLKNDLGSYWRRMCISPLAGIAVFILAFMLSSEAVLISAILLVLWGTAPYTAYMISLKQEKGIAKLDRQDIMELRRIARKTWRYFEDMVNAENNYLPPDNYQEDPPNGVAHRTSPTNIGLMLASTLCAWDLGYIGLKEMLKRLDDSVSVIEKLDKWQGHLYNWYDTLTLDVLRPAYVSTVDSGNFVGYLIVLAEGLKDLLSRNLFGKETLLGIRDTVALFNEENKETGMGIDVEMLDKLIMNHNFSIRELKSLVDKLLYDLSGNDISRHKVKKTVWGKKLLAMLKSFQADMTELFPLLELEEEELVNLELNTGSADGRNSDNLSLTGLQKAYEEMHKKLLEKGSGAVGERRGSAADSVEQKVEVGQKNGKAIQLLEYGKESVFRTINDINDMIRRVSELAEATKFGPLFDHKKQLFSIGYNIEENRLTKAYYDLFASEARQASYIAVARGEVDKKHWFRLGRRLTMVDGYKGLVSWTGTMFEYFMPFLVMKNYENTLLDETYNFAVKAQKKYGMSRGIPWGTSESAYYSFDMKLNYQYKAFGVPELGLKRGLVNDMVVAPYATLLALNIDPVGVIKNIRELIKEGMDGPYGLYEAIDYTPSRLRHGEKCAIVRSFMVHHLGMSLLALDNYLNDNIIQERFHSNPVMRSAELLLQERMPEKALITKEFKEKLIPVKKIVQEEKEVIRKFGIPEGELPQMHIMSNGSYSVMVTDGGSGYSKIGDIAVSRWKGNIRGAASGTFVFVQNINSNTAWSTTYEPFNVVPEEYHVTFYPDKAVFRRKDGNIETRTDIIVSTEENAEIRRVTLTNHSQHNRILEVTSYFEVVLTPADADAAHPAFSNLFVTTEFVAEHNCLLAYRRPRSASQKPIMAMHCITVEGEAVGNLQYETDRSKFIGRNRDISNPVAMGVDQPLSDTAGSVLDPIMSLRKRVTVQPGQSVRLSYITAVGDKKEHLLEIAEKYSDPKVVDRAFELAWNRSQIELRYLGFKAEEVRLYLEMIPLILLPGPVRRKWAWAIEKNREGQPGLWKFGISGDVPIILITLKDTEETDMVARILKAHEYWRLKGLLVDLVILLQDESSYVQPLYNAVRDAISYSHARDMIGAKGGVFILDANTMEEKDIVLLYTVARIVLRGSAASIREELKTDLEKPVVPLLDINEAQEESIDSSEETVQHQDFDTSSLKYFNGIGGFGSDGREYVIYLRDGVHTYAPWINVISNNKFGFIVSESGGGYTWSENSRENKLTPWSNDPVSDIPGEIFYVRDENTGRYWSITPMPIREAGDYIIRHGWGYSVFEHSCNGLEQSLTEFVPVNDPVKICMVRLKNTTDAVKNLSVTYYIRPVLGVNENTTAQYITTGIHKESGMMLLTNTFNPDFPDRIAFMDVSEQVRSITGDRTEFIGLRGSLRNPEALRRTELSGKVGAGLDPCGAVQVKASLEPGQERTIVFLLGQAASMEEALQVASKYKNPETAEDALNKVKSYWLNKLGAIQVKTPDDSIDIMLNGWLQYQVVACRLWARSAFYQSGGAYGYRDQLQDVMAVVYTWPELTREQILLHASHQFLEGDVQHWWHPGADKGIRTRYSDDYLWLPYVTIDYIRNTGDWDILDAIAGYLEDEPLAEDEDERYNIPRISAQKSNIYEHCIRAIENGLKFGPHGIPLIGCGDWNDGMNTVGNKGKGESVWLGWFLYTILNNFIPICMRRGDKERAERYRKAAQDIVDAIENNAWDGSWYRRAYFDDGTPLGSAQNAECRIDSLSQSWSVISGAGKQSRVDEAMHAVENYLVDREVGIIKLLTPPFDSSELQPGYIKGYVPGVRENGGQYTHAAVWTVMAFAKLGEGDTAGNLYHMINPINHARTPMESSRYRVEPYVMAADVYAVHPNVGRGGWTWYTGAAGWMYRVGLEHILGIRKEENKILFNPCIPSTWKEYSIKYRFGAAVYEITIKNPEAVNKGVKSVSLDGKKLEEAVLPLTDDGLEHQVEVIMG